MAVNISLNFDSCLTPSTYYTYQKYYIHGLRSPRGVSCGMMPFSSKVLAYLKDVNVGGVNWVWGAIAKINTNKRSVKSDHVGRYSITLASQQIKFAIDDADGRGIRDKEALDWCDIYFKANKWPDRDYPKKVFPIVSGNGKLDPDKIGLIKGRRHMEKKVDLVYMSKLWSRPDCFENIIEHQVRIFEALAEIDCTKHLRAVVLKESQDELTAYLKRLDAAGVEWSNSWGNITSSVFWDNLAEAKVVFQRSGNHHCMSWRMTDLLCMGACIVMDKSPYPQWPVPLEQDKHFAACDCGFSPDYAIPPKEQYKNIRKVIEALLNDPQAQHRYQKHCRDYFDLHASPQQVAAYILDTLKSEVVAV
ncbi:MAG: hypothetical protein GY807_03510 [Gammaproteobacteria bacterium]|nr:hypothetical protein [Gammaproteobacteria bacterium]